MSSGAINATASLSSWALHENIWPASRTAVIKSKSVRQARGGVSFDTRMLACRMSTMNQLRGEEVPTPLRPPCARLAQWTYFRPWAAPCNYCWSSVNDVAVEVKPRTSSSLLV